MTHGRRADIQGMRALAVLAVVIYHSGLGMLPGGFVGVDVFFVISGFLITRILIAEFEARGRVDLRAFWFRRARRLLPNAFLTLLVTLVVGLLVLPAYLHADLARDAGFAMVFLGNYRFADGAIDYFRTDDPASPLLHFWSLGVEEQFYIALPLALIALGVMVAHHRRRAAILLLLTVVVVSFLWSQHLLQENQPRAFFHGETRAWQLALGGVLGCCFEPIVRRIEPLRPGFAWFGMAAIGFAVVFLSDQDRYPGILALIPTLGAAALLVGAQRSATAMLLLSHRAMQWVGDRSYSLYLWHWPLIVFAGALFPGNTLAAALAALVAFPVCQFAYRHVENPIHRGTWAWSTRRASVVGVTSLAAMAALSMTAVNTQALHGADGRAARIAEARQDFGRNYADGCHLGYNDVSGPDCLYGAAGDRRVMLLGDSHAAQWLEPLVSAAEKQGWSVQAATKTSCPPADVSVWNQARRAQYVACDEWREGILTAIASDPPDLVFLSTATRYDLVDRKRGRKASARDFDSMWKTGLGSLIDRIRQSGSDVVIIQDTPRAYTRFLHCLAASPPEACARPRREALDAGNFLLARIAEESGVPLMDLTDNICGPTLCPVERDGVIVYRDSHHLTGAFATSLSDDFTRMLKVHRIGMVEQLDFD